MDEKNIFAMIDSYFEGDLKPESEQTLFEELANNKEARIHFRNTKILKESIKESEEEFPHNLENQIFSKIKSGTPRKINYFKRIDLLKYASLAVSVILLIISFYLLNSISVYKNEMKDVITKIDSQNKTIELLLNSMPPAEVQGKFTNEIIIKSKL